MFGHIFTYRLKMLMRDKSMIFWTLLFPILLASFFKMAFSGLSEQQTFRVIDVAVVDDANYRYHTDFQSTMEELSTGDDRLFNLHVTDEAKAAELLAGGDIAGYILTGNEMRLIVNNSGISQSIIKSFLDQYNQMASTISRILSENPGALAAMSADLRNRVVYTREVPASSAKLDFILNYFYSLIAMTCLYGGFFGVEEINKIQANISDRAARVNIAPVHKLKAFLYSTSAAVLIQFSELLVLMAYLIFVLSIDFGSRLGLVLLTIFAGTIIGISFGAFISALVKGKEGVKTAVILSVSMAGAFLSGMMFGDVKYIIATKVPVLSIINPVNLLTDAFYALYYYDTYTRYAGNMIGLLVFSLIFCLSTYMIIRRRKYASI